jgi:hypothetical protein
VTFLSCSTSSVFLLCCRAAGSELTLVGTQGTLASSSPSSPEGVVTTVSLSSSSVPLIDDS